MTQSTRPANSWSRCAKQPAERGSDKNCHGYDHDDHMTHRESMMDNDDGPGCLRPEVLRDCRLDKSARQEHEHHQHIVKNPQHGMPVLHITIIALTGGYPQGLGCF
jgi:hypothetical protein